MDMKLFPSVIPLWRHRQLTSRGRAEQPTADEEAGVSLLDGISKSQEGESTAAPADDVVPDYATLADGRRASVAYNADYDLIFVHKKGSEDKRRQRLECLIARARVIGLMVDVEDTRGGKRLLVKMVANQSLLERVAELTTMEKRLKEGSFTDFTIAKKTSFVPASAQSFFTSCERVRLILAALQLNLRDGGCGIVLEDELASGVLEQVVPVHEVGITGSVLMAKWALKPLRVFPHQPLDDIRDYFGERIAMYFAFMQCLTRHLVAPSLAGVAVIVVGLYYGSADNPASPIYSLIMMGWLPYFCKQWRAEEARLAFVWNVEDFEAGETARSGFFGRLGKGIYSPEGYLVTLDDQKHVASAPTDRLMHHGEHWRRVAVSRLVMLPIASTLIIAVTSVLVFRSTLQLTFSTTRGVVVPFTPYPLSERARVTIASVLGGACLAIVIQLTNRLYAWVAECLNTWENHRTQTKHEDGRILKEMTFKFVNSYFALFYVAFVKSTETHMFGTLAEYCHEMADFDKPVDTIKSEHEGQNPFCMTELSSMLIGMAVASQLIGKVVENLVPKLKAAQRARAQAKDMAAAGLDPETHMSFYEKQTQLEPYDVQDDIFREYSRVMIQLGYIVLFAPAFPIASLVSYLSFLFEIRSDAFKLLSNFQRPVYACAQDIGSWQHVMSSLSVASTLTNAGLILYTSTFVSRSLPIAVPLTGVQITGDNKFSAFLVLIILVLGARATFDSCVPDYPVSLAILRAKTRWRRSAAAAAATAAMQGRRDYVVTRDGRVTDPPVEWVDEVIPHRFFERGGNPLGMRVGEPINDDEVTALLGAGMEGYTRKKAAAVIDKSVRRAMNKGVNIFKVGKALAL
jgi:hypothetical protein